MIQMVIAGAVSTVLADWARSYAVPLVRRRLARPTRNASATSPSRNATPASRNASSAGRPESFVRTLER